MHWRLPGATAASLRLTAEDQESGREGKVSDSGIAAQAREGSSSSAQQVNEEQTILMYMRGRMGWMDGSLALTMRMTKEEGSWESRESAGQ